MPLRLMRHSTFILLHDSLLLIAGFYIALYLRVGNEIGEYRAIFLPATAALAVASPLLLAAFRVPQRVWKYISLEDIYALLKALLFILFGFMLLMFLYNRLEGLPRSLPVIHYIVAMALLVAPRLAVRVWKLRSFSLEHSDISQRQRIRVLLIGSNRHAEQFLRDTVASPRSQYQVLGIISPEKGTGGRFIHNVKIYGDLTGLQRTLEKLKEKDKAVQKLVIAPDTLSGDEVKSLLALAETQGLTVSRLPRITDFSSNKESATQLRPIDLEDLLCRPQQALDKNHLEQLLKGKRVLVTGAGGSIGGELCRQVLACDPAHLTLLDASEYNLYAIEQELKAELSGRQYTLSLTDVRQAEHLDQLFTRMKPQVVFHAAALKHVPMSEMNVSEAVLTNVLGSKHIADRCVEHHVETLVMISTDKAVNPTSVMGATKRLAERYVQALSLHKKAQRTQFATIRFGNVLGSNGSVIPMFQKQLAKGGPLTVTHKDMQRYFMTIREAVELVLYAASLVHARQLGHGKIFVLDMGEPVYIRELAEQLIRLAGLQPYKDIDIHYTGLRPGEKLFEELFHGKEAPEKTPYQGILLAQTREDSLSEVEKLLSRIGQYAEKHDENKCVTLLQQAVPEFTPTLRDTLKNSA